MRGDAELALPNMQLAFFGSPCGFGGPVRNFRGRDGGMGVSEVGILGRSSPMRDCRVVPGHPWRLSTAMEFPCVGVRPRFRKSLEFIVNVSRYVSEVFNGYRMRLPPVRQRGRGAIGREKGAASRVSDGAVNRPSPPCSRKSAQWRRVGKNLERVFGGRKKMIKSPAYLLTESPFTMYKRHANMRKD
jgi:hypothetical protein